MIRFDSRLLMLAAALALMTSGIALAATLGASPLATPIAPFGCGA